MRSALGALWCVVCLGGAWIRMKASRNFNLRARFRGRSEPIYFVGQNPITLTGVVITTSTALTAIGIGSQNSFTCDNSRRA